MKDFYPFPLSLTLSIFVAGCAALGTKANLTAKVESDSFRKVALVITKQKTSNPSIDRRVDSLLVKEVLSQLSGLKPTPQVAFIGDADELLGNTELRNNLLTSYNTLLHVEIALSYNGALGRDNGYNSWVRMQAFKIPEKQSLGDTRFNTQMGKTYTKRPTLQESVHDGVIGAFGPWAKKISQRM